MFKFVLDYLIILIISIVFYHISSISINLSKYKDKFDWNKLITGIIKTAIICGGFIMFALIFDKISNVIDTKALDFMPDTLMISAIVFYASKGLKNLIKTIGLESEDIIEIVRKETIEVPLENEIKVDD